MNSKLRLPQTSLITALGVLLCLITTYVPTLSIFSIFLPVPYAIIGTLTDNKNSILSLIATFFILIFTINPLYSLSVCIISIVPGIFIGSTIRNNKEDNKFKPIYIGTIASIVSIIVFFFISNIVFKTNILNDFINVLKETLTLQVSVMQKAGIGLKEGFNVSNIVSYITNILPTILFMQGMLVAFIVYGLEVFILRRIKIVNLSLPKFRDFNLPGNAVSIFFILYLLTLFVDSIKLDYLHTDLIMLNLQLIFNFMFIIQGIAVSIYYLKKWARSGSLKMVFISLLILSIFGFTTVCFVGMLDSIIDFRRIRSYKST